MEISALKISQRAPVLPFSFLFLSFFCIPSLHALEKRDTTASINALYALVQKQAEYNRFIIHDDHLLFPHPYIKRLKYRARSSLQGAEVMYSGKIGSFRKLSDWGGVHIHTLDDTYLQFNLRYYEHIQDLGQNGAFMAICDLPGYTNCRLLGCENNPDDENCYR